MVGRTFCNGRWVLSLALVFGLPTVLPAATYYVRKTGNDSNAGTSPAAAWRTVGKAATSLLPGDKVFVGAGVYNEQLLPGRSGTATSPIQFIADTAGTMTGDAGAVQLTYAGKAVSASQRDYIQVIGFRLSGSTGGALWSQSTEGLLDGCEIASNSGFGVEMANAKLTVNNCAIHDNSSHGIYGSRDSTLLVKLSHLFRNGVAGVFAEGQKTILTVEQCRVDSNVSDGLHSEGGTYKFVNCLVYDNGGDGIEVVQGSAQSAIWNCSISDNRSHGVRQQTGTLTLTNCIVTFNAGNGLNRQSGTLNHSYNLVFGNTGSNYQGTSGGASELNVDPSFVNRPVRDYHLNRRSAAINAGTSAAGIANWDLDGNSRPVGSVWDLGCYESNSGRSGPGVRVLKWSEVR